jgi:hypothetical protein
VPCPYSFKGGVDIQTFKRKKQKTAAGLLTGAAILPEVGSASADTSPGA